MRTTLHSSVIPVIASFGDLEEGIKYAQEHPKARWYVAKMARVYAADDQIPEHWFQGNGPLTAARYGRLPAWQSWLHPRGKDGRFIQSGSMINVFGDPGASIRDPYARRRRAKVERLSPDGIHVSYRDGQGNVMAADPMHGYPEVIPTEFSRRKISAAPTRVARLKGNSGPISAEQEYDNGEGFARDSQGKVILNEAGKPVMTSYKPAKTTAEYETEVEKFNAFVQSMEPSRSMSQKGPAISGEPLPTLNDDEYFAHAGFVTDVVDAALVRKLSGDAAFKDSYGVWSNDQLKQMMLMVDEVHNDLVKGKPKDHKAVVVGGLPGSGKTSTLDLLKSTGAINDADWITLNPDTFKERMWAEGWYPKIDGLSAGETSALVHAQSSEMNAMLENLLVSEGYNVIFDVTMGDHRPGRGQGGTFDWLTSLKNDYGYDLDGIFTNIGISLSKDSILARHRRGVDKLRTQEAFDRNGRVIPNDPELETGGRFVPASIVANAAPTEPGYTSINEQNFDKIRGAFNNWVEYDGSETVDGKEPVLMKSGKGLDTNPSIFPAALSDMPGYIAPDGGGAA